MPVLAAPHLSGERTMTLTLSNPQRLLIDDGEALGTISRTSELPQAWLARFGRTASDQSARAIERRLEIGSQESHLTVAGQRVDTLTNGLLAGGRPSGADGHTLDDNAVLPMAATARESTWPVSPESPDAPVSLLSGPVNAPTAWTDSAAAGFRWPSLREALIGTSFYYSNALAQDDGGGGNGSAAAGTGTGGTAPMGWAVWGDIAATHFGGDKSGLSLDGDVVTGTVGFDRRLNEQWLAGLAVSYSDGEGEYAQHGTGGALSSTLTSLHPYLQYRVDERTQLWGVLGFGAGDLTVAPSGDESVRTDLDNRMVALGGRGVLARRGAAGGFEVALNSDLLWTSTSAEAAGWLAEATGEASRVRLMLDGRGRMALASGGVLIPMIEAGLRYDGGDAETGAGVEIGAGLGYSTGRLTVQFNARGLVAHEDAEYEEWGVSGSIAYLPADDGHGLSATMTSAWGAAQSGVQSLWTRQDAAGISRGGAPMRAAQRFGAELGYGVNGPRGRGLWVPYIGADAAEDGQQVLRLGLKLTSGPNAQAGLEFGRRDQAQGGPQRAIELNGSVRF